MCCRFRFMDPLQREKAFKFWMDIRMRYNVILQDLAIRHMDILIASIFDILPLVSRKRIFESTQNEIFLCILGLQRTPDSENRSNLKNNIVKELLKFFDSINKRKNQGDLKTFLQNLKIISNENVNNIELNEKVLKFVSFSLRRSNPNSYILLRICLKFLSNQSLKFREDLIKNLFDELQKNNDGRIEYFYSFIQILLCSENHKEITENYIRSMNSNKISQIFIPNININKDNSDPGVINFRKRKLDFMMCTSTPLGKKSSNEKLFEHSLEKMCSEIKELKANLKRPLTTTEHSLAMKMIQNLQSML